MYVERGSQRGFEHLSKGDMIVLKTATRFFASLAAAPFFPTHRFRRGLHGVVAAFWLSVFASVFAPVSFLLALIAVFCHFDVVVTMRRKRRYSAENDKFT